MGYELKDFGLYRSLFLIHMHDFGWKNVFVI